MGTHGGYITEESFKVFTQKLEQLEKAIVLTIQAQERLSLLVENLYKTKAEQEVSAQPTAKELPKTKRKKVDSVRIDTSRNLDVGSH